MQDGPSTLSLVAAAFYGVVVVAAIFAGRTAQAYRQQPWQARSWVLVAIFFILLAVWRFFDLEDVVRSDLREWLRAEGLLEGRGSFQGVLIAVALAAFAAISLYAAFWVSRLRLGRRHMAVFIALACCVALLMLLALRLVSLHAVDQLLFGRLKLNWFGDLGASGGVLLAAVYYSLRVRKR